MKPASDSNQRTEDIRKRRSTRTQNHLERAARNLVAPPITTRGPRNTGMGQPLLQRTAVRPRRIFTVTAQKGGHAFSLPAPDLHLGSRALSGALILGVIALLVFLMTSTQFQVIRPEINGAARLSANDIEAVLKLSGSSIFAIDPRQIAKDLEKSYPELQGVTVNLGLPNVVAVQFNERQPVLVWKQKDKPDLWIDARGALFSARGEVPANLVTVQSDSLPPYYQIVPTPGPTPTAAVTPKAPVSAPTATTEPAPDRMDLTILAEALTLSKHLPDKADLIYAQKEGLGWHDSRGWDVYFGKTLTDLEMKISMVQAIINQLGQKGIKPKYINLEFLHAPYYRLER